MKRLWCRVAAKVSTEKTRFRGNMIKDVCLDGNRALETALRKLLLVMCMIVLENASTHRHIQMEGSHRKQCGNIL